MATQMQSPHSPQRHLREQKSDQSTSSREADNSAALGNRSYVDTSQSSPRLALRSSPLSFRSDYSPPRGGTSGQSPTALDFIREQRQLQHKASPYQLLLSKQGSPTRPSVTSIRTSTAPISPLCLTEAQSPVQHTAIDTSPSSTRKHQRRKSNAASRAVKRANKRKSIALQTLIQEDAAGSESSLMGLTPPDFGSDSEDEGARAPTMARPSSLETPPESSSSRASSPTTELDVYSDPYADNNDDPSQNVVVCMRMRRVSQKAESGVWKLEPSTNSIAPTANHPTMAKRTTGASEAAASSCEEGGSYNFRFDSLVGPDRTADGMYADKIAPIVQGVVKGYNGTVFAYGQTGSGKTYTMSGGGNEKGVIPRAIEQIFASVGKDADREYLLRVSYLEIYNENLHDLLAVLPRSASSDALSGGKGSRNSSPVKGGSSHIVAAGNSTSTALRMLESGGRVQINGLREEIVTSADEVLALLDRGQQARHQAATDWNERSSRSHCVFILTVESRAKDASQSDADNHVQISQLNLIDLAGSERAATDKSRRKEGAFINKSLLTLGTVIAKLSEQCSAGKFDGRHIPYRDSKLTRLLQTSLGGNARVAVVCTISPRKEHAVESLSTLRFGQRCKMVVTHAKQGTVVDDKALIARYRQELERLRAQLETAGSDAQKSAKRASMTSESGLKSEREKAEEEMREMNEKRDELKKQVEHLTRLILTGKNVANELDSQDRATDDVHNEESESETPADPTASTMRRIRNSRRSDFGPPSPMRRSRVMLTMSKPLTPLRLNGPENTPLSSTKPFALEAELAQERKKVSQALAAKQAADDEHAEAQQAWQRQISELEATIKEQAAELHEAEEACNKLEQERDAFCEQVDRETEANRALKLLAQSREEEIAKKQEDLQKQKEVLGKLHEELDSVKRQNEHIKTTSQEKAEVLEMQVASLKQAVEEVTQQAAQHQSSEKEQVSAEKAKLLQEKAALTAALAEAEHKAVNAAAAACRPKDDEIALLKSRLERIEVDKESEHAALIATKELKEREADAKSVAHQEEAARLQAQIERLQEQLLDRDALVAAREEEVSAAQDARREAEEMATQALALHTQNEEQTARIAELEARLKEAQKETPSLPPSPLEHKTPARLKKVVEDQEGADDSLADVSTSMLRPGPFLASKALLRGGSMRELKSGSLRGDASISVAALDVTTLQLALKEEHEEVERLNEIIRSQRSIMSELESSVAEWKQRLRSQHDIINQLVAANNRPAERIPREPVSASCDTTLFKGGLKAERPPLSATSSANSAESVSSNLLRSNSERKTTNAPQPYYGAHLFNRPPPSSSFSSLKDSRSIPPTKGMSWTPSTPALRPDPLPITDSTSNVSMMSTTLTSSPSRLRRRKTIEEEIESLKGSPRVENTKHRLLEPVTVNSSASSLSLASQPQTTSSSPSKASTLSTQWSAMSARNQNASVARSTNAIPSPPLRSSRDYYI